MGQTLWIQSPFVEGPREAGTRDSCGLYRGSARRLAIVLKEAGRVELQGHAEAHSHPHMIKRQKKSSFFPGEGL